MPPPARNLKPTLFKYKNQIATILGQFTELDKPTHKIAIKTIHTSTVGNPLASYPPNIVLGYAPPDINEEEPTLPRTIRSSLSQLRSGYSKLLNSYNHRLNEAIPDTCPKCQRGPHTTPHLFECPANPTELTPESLWTQPTLAAQVLGLETDTTSDVES